MILRITGRRDLTGTVIERGKRLADSRRRRCYDAAGMGISMALLAAADHQIRDHLDAPQTADACFARVESMPDSERCLLHDRWAVIHFLCVGDMEDGRPPLGLLRAGEIEVPATSELTYAVSAGAAQAWSAALRALTDEELRRRLDEADLLTAGPEGRPMYPGRWYLGQEQTDNGPLFDELLW